MQAHGLSREDVSQLTGWAKSSIDNFFKTTTGKRTVTDRFIQSLKNALK